MHARIATHLGLVLAVAPGSDTAHANHEEFRYKLPCLPQEPCFLTTQLHANGSLDFDINGSGSSGIIRAMAEGVVASTPVQNTVWATFGLGRQVIVGDIHGGTTIYAHLASVADGIASGSGIIQATALGIEGDTGFTIDPEDQVCKVHLHWQTGSLPEFISSSMGVRSRRCRLLLSALVRTRLRTKS